VGQARRGADIDRQQVVVHRRALGADHAALAAVDVDHLIAVEAGAGELTQPAQVDMHIVERIMTGDVARQHAGIGRVGVATDDGQADTGLWLHGKAHQHADVAVPTADQDDITHDRRFDWHGSGRHRESR